MRMGSSSALLGIVLAVSMFGAGVVTDRLTNVYITNLPLDEQGNLRTAIVHESKTMLVFNQTVTVPSSTSNWYYLTSFDTSGFKYFLIMAKGAKEAFQLGASVSIYWYENNFGIQTIPSGVDYVGLYSSPNFDDPHFGTGVVGSIGIQIEAYAPSVDLYLRVYNSNIGFNGLLTIAVYLTN